MSGMEYFYLKMGVGNSEVSKHLKGSNPKAVIYFDDLDEEAYKIGKGKSQPRDFYSRGLTKENREKTRMVVVHRGNLWILQPTDEVQFKTIDGRPSKVMPVEILLKKSTKDVPSVLASIGVNQFYARGTFRRINHWGNFKAIDCVLKAPRNGKHWKSKQNPEQLLECLGALEFETLIAKLLEEKGCFVPAYRGGLIADIDLFAHNDSANDVCVGEMVIKAKSSASIQVKTWSNQMTKPDGVDHLIGLDVEKYNAKWVLDRVRECPKVETWLIRSLDWLPEDFLRKFKLTKPS